MQVSSSVSFDDLDDFDSLPAVASSAIKAEPSLVPCYAGCHNGQKLIGYAHQRYVTCFVCRGTGKVKPNAQKRRAAWKKGQQTQANNKALKMAAFAKDHPDVISWLNENAGHSFAFATSLQQSYNDYGSLTEGQVRAVRNCLQKQVARLEAWTSARTSDAGTGGKSVLEALRKAVVAGKGSPKMRTEHATFSLAKATSKNPGCAYVTGTDKVYLGKITPDFKFIASRDCSGERQTAILEVLKNPLDAAVKYGRLTGACSCCGRRLDNKQSIELGIGPICRSKMFGG